MEDFPVMTSSTEEQIDWSLATWKGSRLKQHRDYLALPFRRKIELIEEMCDASRRITEIQKQQGLPSTDPRNGTSD